MRVPSWPWFRGRGKRSGAYERAVGAAVLGHVAWCAGGLVVEQRGRLRLVDVEAQAGRLVRVQVAALEPGVARERLELFGTEVVLLLNAEVPARHVQVHRRGLVDRVVVAALLPGGLDAVPLAQVGDLLRLCDAA